MSQLIVAGRLGAREMPLRSVWRRVGGSEYERRWWGPIADVEALLPGLRAGASEVTFDPIQGSPIAVASVRYAGVQDFAELTSEVMTIEFSDQTFPVSQNPTFINLTSNLIKDLEELLKTGADNPYSDTESEAYRYYELRSRQIESYRAQLPIVTWTRVVGPNYPTSLDLADVGQIFNTDQMVSQLGAPVLWDVPTGNVGVDEDDYGMFTAGWLKTCSAGFTADGQVQLVIRGEFGLWAQDLYVVNDPS